jgi:hypothetical protein
MSEDRINIAFLNNFCSDRNAAFASLTNQFWGEIGGVGSLYFGLQEGQRAVRWRNLSICQALE